MVANGTAPCIPQSTEGSSFEPSVRKKILQKVSILHIFIIKLVAIYINNFRLIGQKVENVYIILLEG